MVVSFSEERSMKRMFVAGLASILLAGQSYAAVVNVENAGI